MINHEDSLQTVTKARFAQGVIQLAELVSMKVQWGISLDAEFALMLANTSIQLLGNVQALAKTVSLNLLGLFVQLVHNHVNNAILPQLHVQIALRIAEYLSYMKKLVWALVHQVSQE